MDRVMVLASDRIGLLYNFVFYDNRFYQLSCNMNTDQSMSDLYVTLNLLVLLIACVFVMFVFVKFAKNSSFAKREFFERENLKSV